MTNPQPSPIPSPARQDKGRNKFLNTLDFGPSSSLNLEKQARYLYVDQDPTDGGVKAIPVFLVAPQSDPVLTRIRAQSVAGQLGDAFGGGTAVAGSYIIPYNYNASAGATGTYDRVRNNVTLFDAADVTTSTYTGPDILTYNAKSILVLIDVTTFTDTSYAPEVDWKDFAGNYRVLWQQKTVKTGAAATLLVIGPGCLGAQVVDGATVGDAAFGTTDSATANELVQIGFPVPTTIRIKVTKVHAAGAFTGHFTVQGS